MAGREVKVVFKCVLCPKAYSNVQALRAHLKVHKNEGYVRTSIYAKEPTWQQFKEMCKKHNTTTCQLLNALIEATLKGEERGVIDIPTTNPILINVPHYFLGTPRSRLKVPIRQDEYERLGGISRGPEVYRDYYKRHIRLEKLWTTKEIWMRESAARLGMTLEQFRDLIESGS